MALLAATLKTELLAIPKGFVEADAFASAYITYMKASAAGGIPANPAPFDSAKATMVSAMAGLNTSADTALAAGFSALWGLIVAAPATYYTGTITPGVVPAGLATLAAGLLSLAASNTAAALDDDTAVGNFANTIHTASLGGTVTLPGSPPTVIPVL